jgi:hypothetical protein
MNKENICRHFFKGSSKEHHWDCKLCSDGEGYSTKVLKQKKGTGWSNLFSHIQSVHKDYQNIVKENTKSMFIVPGKVKNMHSWIELMVMRNLPLALVDDELFRRASCYDPVSSNSLKKYMELLCRRMEDELRTILPISGQRLVLFIHPSLNQGFARLFKEETKNWMRMRNENCCSSRRLQ